MTKMDMLLILVMVAAYLFFFAGIGMFEKLALQQTLSFLGTFPLNIN